MIEEVKRKKGSSFRAVIYGADGNRIRKTFPNRTLAKEWERRMLHERDQEKASGVRIRHSVTFSEFTERWLTEKVHIRLAESTRYNYQRIVRVHLNPIFEGMKLSQIRVDHANRLVSELTQAGHAPKGINVILGVLMTILNDAVEWQCLARNPLFRYKPVKEPELHFEYWTAPEIQQFLNAMVSDELLPLYITALNTGMRRGELCALKWDRVDFVRNQIAVTRNLTRFGLAETTKSGRKRFVPLSAIVRGVLEQLLKEQRGEFVFSDKEGNPVDAHHLYRDFQIAQKKAGFARQIRFHDLRHTFASHFMMNGGNIYDLQKILGHASLEMTQRYAHMSPDHLAKAIEVVAFQPSSGKVTKLEDARKERKVGEEE